MVLVRRKTTMTDTVQYAFTIRVRFETYLEQQNLQGLPTLKTTFL